MKKLIALIMIACLLFTASTVFAEILQADGSPQVFDGFVLNLDADVVYVKEAKLQNQVYVQVYPYYAINGDDTTNFNAVWSGGSGTITADDVRSMFSYFRTSFAETYAASGYTLESIEFSDPYESILDSEQCVIMETQQIILDPSETRFDLFQRQYYVGSNGFIFTLSGRSRENLESVCAIFENVLAWQ